MRHPPLMPGSIRARRSRVCSVPREASRQERRGERGRLRVDALAARDADQVRVQRVAEAACGVPVVLGEERVSKERTEGAEGDAVRDSRERCGGIGTVAGDSRDGGEDGGGRAGGVRPQRAGEGMFRPDPLREPARGSSPPGVSPRTAAARSGAVGLAGVDGERHDSGDAAHERPGDAALVPQAASVRRRRRVRRRQRREQLAAHGVRVEHPGRHHARARPAHLVDARRRGAHQASAQRAFRPGASSGAYHGDDPASGDALNEGLGRRLDVREERVRLGVAAASRAHPSRARTPAPRQVP